jgi:L-aspartate oxidase
MKGLPAETDFVVIGAGVAGLRAAIELASAGRVLLLTKEEIQDPARHDSVAGELSDEEEISLHLQDTLIAGDGLCHQEAVKILVDEGTERIEELLSWSKPADRATKLVFGSEASYKHSHILRAPGASAASEIARELLTKARSLKHIAVQEFEFCTGLVTEDGGVTGVSLIGKQGLPQHVACSAVLLASSIATPPTPQPPPPMASPWRFARARNSATWSSSSSIPRPFI